MQPVPLRLRGSKPRPADLEPQTLGEHIKRRRLMLNMTKRHAAVRLGVGSETVRLWESGETENPPVERNIAMFGFEAPDVWLTGMGMDNTKIAPEANRWAGWIAIAHAN